MEELKRCPFCGGEANSNFHERLGHLIRCQECGNMTCWHNSELEAIAAWNRRATQNIGKKECCEQDGRCTFDE